MLQLAAIWLLVSAPALASQGTLVTPGPPLPMTSLASFLDSALLSIGSCNSGTSAPANGTGGIAFAGECWINTTSNPWVLSYTPDGVNWLEVGTLNTSTLVWQPASNGFAINLAGALTTSGAFGLTLTSTATTNATLPAGTHTLAGLDVNQTFSGNLTLSGTDNFTGTVEVNGNAMTFPGVAATLAYIAGSQTYSGNNTFSGTNNFTGPFEKSGTAENFPASGNLVGTTDTQTLTNKTFNCANNTCTVRLASDVTGQLPIANNCPGSTGASSTTFLRGDCTWATPSGGGNISTSGTPSANQVGVFASSTTLEGVGPGTLGQQLTSNGSGSPPSYASGGWVLLNTLTASNSATLSDTTHITSSYNEYLFVFENIIPVTTSVTFEAEVHSNGGFQSGSYSGAFLTTGSGGTVSNNPTTVIQLSQGASLLNTAALNGEMTLFTPSNTSNPKGMMGQTVHANGTVFVSNTFSGQWQGGNTAVDGMEFFMSSGNISSGVIKIYGRL